MENEFKRLDLKNKEESGKVMKELLDVWNNNCIYICHPNHLDINPDEIINGDWDNINVDKMFEKGDYQTFITFQCDLAYNYLKNRLINDFKMQLAKKDPDNAICYLVVLEGYRYNSEDNYLVRGIVRADRLGMSVAFNPEYEKIIVRNPFEIGLRLGDDERSLPEAYKKSRRK